MLLPALLPSYQWPGSTVPPPCNPTQNRQVLRVSRLDEQGAAALANLRLGCLEDIAVVGKPAVVGLAEAQWMGHVRRLQIALPGWVAADVLTIFFRHADLVGLEVLTVDVHQWNRGTSEAFVGATMPNLNKLLVAAGAWMPQMCRSS